MRLDATPRDRKRCHNEEKKSFIKREWLQKTGGDVIMTGSEVGQLQQGVLQLYYILLWNSTYYSYITVTGPWETITVILHITLKTITVILLLLSIIWSFRCTQFIRVSRTHGAFHPYFSKSGGGAKLWTWKYYLIKTWLFVSKRGGQIVSVGLKQNEGGSKILIC